MNKGSAEGVCGRVMKEWEYGFQFLESGTLNCVPFLFVYSANELMRSSVVSQYYRKEPDNSRKLYFNPYF